MGFYTILKKILNFKIFFLKPKKNKILIYDKKSIKFAKIIFPKKNFSIYDVSFESLNIYVFFKTFFNTFYKDFFLNYKKNYFNYVQPKIIYTSIDTNLGFYKLKNIFPNALYISDQNGLRSRLFYKNFKKNKEKLTTDLLFCFGDNDKNKIKKIINAKIFSLGNTINNQFNEKFSAGSKIKKIIFIYSGGKKIIEVDKKIFSNLIIFCKKKKIKLFLLDKVNGKNKNLFFSTFSKNFTYLSMNSYLSNYKIFDHNTLAVFSRSTLGFELMSRGIKAITFAINKKYHVKINDNRVCFVKLKSYKKFETSLIKIIKYKNNTWKKISKKYSKKIISFDYKNLEKKKIIRNYYSKFFKKNN